MYLQRIPDGADDDGVLFFRDVGEEDFTPTYAFMPKLPGDAKADPAPSITCPVCNRTSYHPEDIRHGYCGHCHAYTTQAQR
jgi:hypothetical protein